MAAALLQSAGAMKKQGTFKTLFFVSWGGVKVASQSTLAPGSNSPSIGAMVKAEILPAGGAGIAQR